MYVCMYVCIFDSFLMNNIKFSFWSNSINRLFLQIGTNWQWAHNLGFLFHIQFNSQRRKEHQVGHMPYCKLNTLMISSNFLAKNILKYMNDGKSIIFWTSNLEK